jgi:ABC-type dipeptide/oligopeptide/nickel transport system permease component
MQGILPFVVRRLMWAPFVLLAVSLATFALGRFGPGDPIEILQGQYHDPEVVERIRHERGLDDPFFVQYGNYMWDALHGDLGTTFAPRGVPVEDIIFDKMWVTIQYNLVALFIIFAIGIPVGIWAALRQGTWQDPLTISVFLFFRSVPVLVIIPILQFIFAIKLGWLPSSGWEERDILGMKIGLLDKRIIMPILALSLPGIAAVARLMRAQTLEVLDEDFVRTARAKGLREVVVISRHVARNALLPMTTIVGFALVGLLGGSLFVETLFGIPGIGQFTWEAVGNRDYDVIMAVTLITASAFIVANLITDITYGFIDPRVRLGGGGPRY